jgi:formylglycine-generating enzyme required for sulfatase activity
MVESASQKAFLSYNSKDTAIIERISLALAKKGVRSWFDRKLNLGDPWQAEIQKELEAAYCCVVFVSVHSLGDWQEDEIAAAIHLSKRRDAPSYPVIPVLLNQASTDILPPFLRQLHALQLTDGENSSTFNELAGRLLQIQNQSIRENPQDSCSDSTPTESLRCPYRGLEYFDEKDTADFYGRDQAVNEMLRRLARKAEAGNPLGFLALVGNSGAGKSSLLRAGVLPALRAGRLPDSQNWSYVLMRPGRHPVQELSWALRHDQPLCSYLPTAAALQSGLVANKDALHQETRAAFYGDEHRRRLVLLIDQFEEVFTVCDDKAIRTAFLDNLLQASTAEHAHIVVILTLRADCFGRSACHPELAQEIADNTFFVTQLSPKQLQEAIEKPALNAGLTVDPGLVGTILNDAKDEAGVMPLIQHCLLELYHKRDGNRLTLTAYQSIGGIEMALQQRASKVYDSLDSKGKEVCRRVLLRLTQLADGSRIVRRRVSDVELRWDDVDSAITSQVIDILSAPHARLLTLEATEGDPPGRIIEVAHEALITQWPLLRTWLKEAGRDLELQQETRSATAKWLDSGKDPNYLFAGIRLRKLERLAQKPGALNEPEIAFLRACKKSRRHSLYRRAASWTTVMGLSATLIVFLYIAWVDFMNSSAKSQLNYLASESDQLWPARPALISRMDHWISTAQRLLEARDRIVKPAWAHSDPPDPSEARQISNRLADLAGDGRHSLQGMIARRKLAQTIGERILKDESLWNNARARIARDNRFAGFELHSRPGFVPLGPDPVSKLEEFAHLESSVDCYVPRRRADGQIDLNPECGFVFVLVPAGTITSEGTGYVGAKPGVPANIRPFFISKYEVTQAQWIHLTGKNPSRFRPDTDRKVFLVKGRELLHPVEKVTWRDCESELSKCGAFLPLEREWMYACFGCQLSDSTTSWDVLMGNPAIGKFCNVADKSAELAKANLDRCENWDDGYAIHAPVDTCLPNLFGLYHMYGNVGEWCFDLFYAQPQLTITRESAQSESADERVIRGGDYANPLQAAGPTSRRMQPPGLPSNMVGVRPVCPTIE